MPRQVVGAFSRYSFDVTELLHPGEKNCLAVRVHPVDHPGIPDTQLVPLGPHRNEHKEIMKDVTLPLMSIGYDCMPTVPDRQTGLWQKVELRFTGPVIVRSPFVKSSLPLPRTSPARLVVSAQVRNASGVEQRGMLVGRIEETGGEFKANVKLAPGEGRQIVFRPEDCAALVVEKPRLWWPHNYGPRPLYHLRLRFEIGGQPSDEVAVQFGIRQLGRELHELDGAHGLRVLVNGQRIFCRGGYLQPPLLLDWDIHRMEAEIRYLSEANVNLVYFEDIPNPSDEFLDLCDRYGLMFGNCFYGCSWMQPGTPHPLDLDLLARGTVDIIERYRNHPSLVLYMAMNEGETREGVYTRWRKEIVDRDGTRLWIPSGYFPDSRKNVPPWIKPDTPVGVNDVAPKSYGWVEPAQYFRWVRQSRNWMFMLESGAPSVPSLASLRRFLPDCDRVPAESDRFPLTPAWAHHDAYHYFRPFDDALRRIFGRPASLADYCRQSQLLTADQHRAMFEAANHRLWSITSGFSEWKLNACWPSVEWQLYDWYLTPLVSYYYVRKACRAAAHSA